MQRKCILQTRAHRQILELDRSRNRKHVEFQLGELVCIWRFRQERNSLDHGVMETGLDQFGFLLINDATTEGFVEIVWCVDNTSLYRAAPEHIRRATTRCIFLHEVHSANLLPSQFEQVLQN